MTKLDKTFDAEVQKSLAPGGWTYVIWPEAAAFFKTGGLVKVRGTIDGRPFRSSFMAMGGGVHKLPVTKDLLAKVGKAAGSTVRVRLEERLG